MKNALTLLKPALQQLTKSKINFILAFIPVLIGVAIYYFLGSWFYGTVMNKGQEIIGSYITGGGFGTIIYYIIAAIVSILLFLLVNWTFVLMVSIISSPFNDMLSSRIEKNIINKEQDDISSTFSDLFKNILSVLSNEIKKVTFIFLMSVVAFILGYIPLLTPLSLFITVILLAVSFIDYSWARHNIKFSNCLSDLRRNFIGYGIGGTFFFILVSIPIVNLIVSPLATSYFTLLWLKNNEHRNKVTE